MTHQRDPFEEIQAHDKRAEHRIFIGEVVLLAVIAIASFAYWHLTH